ncbi:hypothetical protein [Carboxylicivirga caseinilyticus]|uniref:hypothetical protein n=1 Tax=Carboxylicivirga caseinilyticus TaxID=3417572 RepID=UPI003D34F2A8|nr:hypothetical protein [Marinilabiliaceae bacterium A049]
MKYIYILISLFVFLSCHPSKQTSSEQATFFQFEIETKLKGEPELIYDKLTGDISPWWDHTFSEKPYQLYIEAKPGGGFFEIFDESGDGVRHAVVTGAQRGKLLRMEGPLGLAGHALNLVCTYNLSSAEDSTIIKLEVHGSGEYQDEWPEVIEKVWSHFLIEQFKPYWEESIK